MKKEVQMPLRSLRVPLGALLLSTTQLPNSFRPRQLYPARPALTDDEDA